MSINGQNLGTLPSNYTPPNSKSQAFFGLGTVNPTHYIYGELWGILGMKKPQAMWGLEVCNLLNNLSYFLIFLNDTSRRTNPVRLSSKKAFKIKIGTVTTCERSENVNMLEVSMLFGIISMDTI